MYAGVVYELAPQSMVFFWLYEKIEVAAGSSMSMWDRGLLFTLMV